jgi:dihydroorotate dehydrogenase electron transfer subunit
MGLPRRARVTDVVVENTRTKTLVLDARLEATPGQFVMLWLPGLEEKPFSLANDDPVMLTVARVGPFTRALHELRVGDQLWLRGPLGHGFTNLGRRAVLVGGGYGVAPLAFLARRLKVAGVVLTAIVGARTAEDVILVQRFERLGVPVMVTTEDGSKGICGLVTDAVEPLLARGEADIVYACGPNGMLEALIPLCRRYGVPAQLSWEAYIRCGMGLCGSCERPDPAGRDTGWLVCRDGPVGLVV